MTEAFITNHRENNTLDTIHKVRYWVTRVNLNQGLNFTSDIEPTLIEFNINLPHSMTDDSRNALLKADIKIGYLSDVIILRVINDTTVDSTISEYDNSSIPLSVFKTEKEARDKYQEQLKDIRFTLEKRIKKIKEFDNLIQDKINKGE